MYKKVLGFFKRTHRKYNSCWKKYILPLTKEELKSYQEAKVCYICGKGILEKFAKHKNYQKGRDHCHYAGKYRGAAFSICNLKFNVPNEIPVVFHSDSNKDYDFVTKELGSEFEGEFEYLRENKEKYKTFSVLIKKKITKIDKDGDKSVVNISYKIKLLIVQDLWQVHYQILLII